MELATPLHYKIFAGLVLGLYFFCLLMIFFYSLTQLQMLRYFKRYIEKPKPQVPEIKNFPFVTIQLPIYNEYYVVERLMAAVTSIEYPKEKLEIQVLDDSTDESLALTRKIVNAYQKKGFPIFLITRTERIGYKAGALREGLKTAQGDFIAIFDADFIPSADWLKKTIPHFHNTKVGVVQTRWGHLNRDYSIWTQVQAFALDTHFLLEQIGRNQQGHFINFNGTAGIWRKECILDAGNWNDDTLTEDLDLSYRAQLKGWKFVFLDDVIAPAELPVALSAIRSQQFRWNKGGAENFRKLIKKVLQSKAISTDVKYNAFFHLINSTMFVFVSLLAILSVPILFIKSLFPLWSDYFHIGSLFITSTLIFFICYWYVHRVIYGSGYRSFFNYIQRFILFYGLVMGFSIHNAIAVFEGHLGKKSPFVRTPKFNLDSVGVQWKMNKYLPKKRSVYTYIELVVALYFLMGLCYPFWVGAPYDLGMFPFHLLLFFGFGSIAYYGFKSP